MDSAECLLNIHMVDMTITVGEYLRRNNERSVFKCKWEQDSDLEKLILCAQVLIVEGHER